MKLSTRETGRIRLSLVATLAVLQDLAVAQTFEIGTVGNGRVEDVYYVLNLLRDMSGTDVNYDPNTGHVTFGQGGNALAEHLREIERSNVAVGIGVDAYAKGIVMGQWYMDSPTLTQNVDVEDLKNLPRAGNEDTVGPTAFSVHYHEIEQMYVGLQDPNHDYYAAHDAAIKAENLVHEVWNNAGRRDLTNDTEYFDLGNFMWRTVNVFTVGGMSWIVEGTVLNHGAANTTGWARDWTGPGPGNVPLEQLTWQGYRSYPVPEPTGLLVFGAVLGVIARRRHKV